MPGWDSLAWCWVSKSKINVVLERILKLSSKVSKSSVPCPRSTTKLLSTWRRPARSPCLYEGLRAGHQQPLGSHACDLSILPQYGASEYWKSVNLFLDCDPTTNSFSHQTEGVRRCLVLEIEEGANRVTNAKWHHQDWKCMWSPNISGSMSPKTVSCGSQVKSACRLGLYRLLASSRPSSLLKRLSSFPLNA